MKKTIGVSLERHLNLYFEHNTDVSKKDKEFFSFFGWLFDQLGMDVYRMNAKRIKETVDEYLQSPDRNQTKLKNNKDKISQFHNLRKWNDFLFSSPVDNYIRPIHEKLKKLDIRNIEGKIANSQNDTEKVKQLTNLLKQLNTNEEQPDSNVIVTETVPTQKLFDCRNKSCVNTLLVYHDPIILCGVCGYKNTDWTKTE